MTQNAYTPAQQQQRLLIDLGAPIPRNFPMLFDSYAQVKHYFRSRSADDCLNADIHVGDNPAFDSLTKSVLQSETHY